MATKCTTCGGVYNATLPDNSSYMHACAPLVIRELKPTVGPNIYFCSGIGAASVSLTIPKVGTKTVVSTGFVDTMVFVNEYTIEQPSKRDENIVTALPEGKAVIKSPGKGTTTV